MSEIKTGDLEKTLESIHPEDIEDYFEDNEYELLDEHEFTRYFDAKLKEKKMNRRNVFLEADIPERYGYKLLTGEKHTSRRDVILRLCYGAGFSYEETVKALKLYGMPALYARIPRDALLISVFSHPKGDIFDVNELLTAKGFEPLTECGEH